MGVTRSLDPISTSLNLDASSRLESQQVSFVGWTWDFFALCLTVQCNCPFLLFGMLLVCHRDFRLFFLCAVVKWCGLQYEKKNRRIKEIFISVGFFVPVFLSFFERRTQKLARVQPDTEHEYWLQKRPKQGQKRENKRSGKRAKQTIADVLIFRIGKKIEHWEFVCGDHFHCFAGFIVISETYKNNERPKINQISAFPLFQFYLNCLRNCNIKISIVLLLK